VKDIKLAFMLIGLGVMSVIYLESRFQTQVQASSNQDFQVAMNTLILGELKDIKRIQYDIIKELRK